MGVRVVVSWGAGIHAVLIAKGDVVFLVEVNVCEIAPFFVITHAALLVQMLPIFIINLTNGTERE